MSFFETCHRAFGCHNAAADGLAVGGLFGILKLPVFPLPEVDFPVIAVGASLPGEGPETMVSAVATPLGREFGRIAGVNERTSVSQLGATSITLQIRP